VRPALIRLSTKRETLLSWMRGSKSEQHIVKLLIVRTARPTGVPIDYEVYVCDVTEFCEYILKVSFV
jgi:hypothetical protein